MSKTLPRCTRCLMEMGLRITGTQAIWICPSHGVGQRGPLSGLNGHYDLAKIGGSE